MSGVFASGHFRQKAPTPKVFLVDTTDHAVADVIFDERANDQSLSMSAPVRHGEENRKTGEEIVACPGWLIAECVRRPRSRSSTLSAKPTSKRRPFLRAWKQKSVDRVKS
jgi:hypothetical protein